MRSLPVVAALLAALVLVGGGWPVSPVAVVGGVVVAAWIVLTPSGGTSSVGRGTARNARPNLRRRLAATAIALVTVALVSVDAGRYLLPAALGNVVRELVPSARGSQGDDASGVS